MRKEVLKRVLALLPWVLLLSGGRLLAEGPAWWTNRNVLATGTGTNDFAPVNMGQLKWVATNAAAELDALPGGRGTNLQAILNAWLPDGTNYCLVNVGQLKFLASNVWHRLIDAGYTNALPWTNAPASSDFGVANIGQVKSLFSFQVAQDTDGDGLPDAVEDDTGMFVDPYHTGTSAANADSDGDGITDGVEVAARTDPNNSDTNKPSVMMSSPANNSHWTYLP